MPHPADPVPAVPAPRDPAAPPAGPAGHAAHDTLLVAAYAAGDATGRELETATALVAACPDCAALHHDLRAIAAALPEMPAPRRPRDFRLTPGQAASLRPAGWRRLLAPFAGPRFAFAAPLGTGLAALGLAGILLAGPGLPLGGATSGGAEGGASNTSGAGTVPVPARAAASPGTGAASPLAGAPSPGAAVMAQDASAAPAASAGPQMMLAPAEPPASGAAPEDTAVKSETAPDSPFLPLASLVGLVAGIVLLVLRYGGRSAVRSR